MRRVSNFTSYFVIASGISDTKVRAIADGIEEVLGKKNISAWHKEGYRDAKWIVLDFADVIVHIFYDETRKFYVLEQLWNDAPKIPVK